MAIHSEVKPLSAPNVYLLGMACFLVLVGFIALILYKQIAIAFNANPGLNGLILFVLFLGAVFAFRQIIRLFREIRWVNSLRSERVQPPRDLHIRGHVNVVFRKVDARFKEGHQCDKLLLYRSHPPAQRTAKLLGGHPRLVQRLCRNQVAHRLSLRQVDASMQKGALGKLARPREARTRFESPPYQKVQDYWRAMRRNLHHIFTSVRIWSGEPGDDALVQSGAMIHDGTIARTSR